MKRQEYSLSNNEKMIDEGWKITSIGMQNCFTDKDSVCWVYLLQ